MQPSQPLFCGCPLLSYWLGGDCSLTYCKDYQSPTGELVVLWYLHFIVWF